MTEGVRAPAGGVERLRAAFEGRAGRAPDGVWWAPGRVNLIGEHTDYNDGFVLPFALDLGTLAAVGRRDDGLLRCWSLQEPESRELRLDELGPGAGDGWTAYVGGVAWALGRAGVAVAGADVVVDSTVPEGSGLSSSAALECSVGLALSELHDGGLDGAAIARAARQAENEVVGVPSGVMDQMASMLGREGHALFLDTRSLESEQIPLDLASGGLALLVVDTRASRELASGEYAERRAACEAAAQELGVAALRDATRADVDAAAGRLGDVGHRRARHVVTENARVLDAVAALRAGRVDQLGPLLDASHRSLRDDYEVSSRELDAAVEAARAAGAAGARMTGGGFGGCAIALVPADAAGAVGEAVATRFADERLGEPLVFPVTPFDGARRVA